MKSLRTNLLLLALTLAVCGVAYPLGLWVVGQVVFPDKANGSLLTAKGPDATERAVGSGLIAQKFTGDEYFWPRPSAADYNGAAAGGSNLGANSPRLRDRVAQQLGPMIRYKRGSASAPGSDASTAATSRGPMPTVIVRSPGPSGSTMRSADAGSVSVSMRSPRAASIASTPAAVVIPGVSATTTSPLRCGVAGRAMPACVRPREGTVAVADVAAASGAGAGLCASAHPPAAPRAAPPSPMPPPSSSARRLIPDAGGSLTALPPSRR